jgi:hypothetical protein
MELVPATLPKHFDLTPESDGIMQVVTNNLPGI